MFGRRNLLKFTFASIALSAMPLHASIPLLKLPVSVDWCSPVGDNWGIFLNYYLGNCVDAACANAVLQWTTINNHPLKIKDTYIERFYEANTGYVHNVPHTDNGSVTWDTLNYWRDTGWSFNKLAKNYLYARGFLNVKNRTSLKTAIYYFGGILLDVEVPNEYFETENKQEHFKLGRKLEWPKITDTHSMYIAAYDENTVTTISHGRASLMDWGFLEKYSIGAYVLLNPLWIKNGYSPNGYKYSFLKDKIKELNIDKDDP